MTDCFDYVIVGAGSAGSLLANRLSAEPGVTVCLIEAGGTDRHPFLSIPAGFVKTLYGDRFTWPIKTEAVPGLDGRVIALPQGKVLGGSSSINGLVYNRGRRADYDDWAKRGNPGWGYDDLLPYFKRSERKIGAGDDRFRGRQGETIVTETDWHHPLCDAFIAAAIDAGIPRVADYNGESHLGTGYCQRIISRGRRVSAATAYLRSAIRTGAVDVRTRCQAARIVFDGMRATGIEYLDAMGRTGTVNARREVVLSGGAVNTPKLLQLSGIGPEAVLRGANVAVKHVLPGVGENLRDHYAVRLVAKARNTLTINEYARWPRLGLEIAKWVLGRPSVLGLSPTLAFANCPAGDAEDDSQDVKVIFTPGSYKQGRTYVLDDFPGMTCGVSQQRPRSSGYVRIISNSPTELPLVQPNYLADPADQRAIVRGLRQARLLLHSRELAPYLATETLPGTGVQEDGEWLEFARRNGNTGYHLVGTCKMGPSDDRESVVDASLRVHGLERLRVVDASIMPMIPAANTYAATLAIAEKAADLIRSAHKG